MHQHKEGRTKEERHWLFPFDTGKVKKLRSCRAVKEEKRERQLHCTALDHPV